MSEPNSMQNVEGVATPERPDDVERVEELADTWDSSPLTDPVEAQDPEADRLSTMGTRSGPMHRASAARTINRGDRGGPRG